MKAYILVLLSFLFALPSKSQTKNSLPDASKKVQVVEAACGECQFNMKGNSCDLAVRIKGKPYFVDGTSIDQHGDAHAKDGFCNAIRKAQVQGEVVDGRFKATYFKLVSDKRSKPVTKRMQKN